MAEGNDIIAKSFSKYFTAFTLSKAILEDYAKVVARLENIPEQEVTERVRKRSDELFAEIREELAKEAAEVKPQ